MEIRDLPTVTCPHGGGIACYACVQMCLHKPCWPTPEEAEALIRAGYGDRLMRDWWDQWGSGGQYAPIYLLSPAKEGYAGETCESNPRGPCVLLSPRGFCTLHQQGLKPLEGRLADCQKHVNEAVDIHEEVARTWDTPEAQALVERWRVQYGDLRIVEEVLDGDV